MSLRVREEPAGGGVTSSAGAAPTLARPDWTERFPDLVQGVTTRGSDTDPFDLRLSGNAPGGAVLARWERLRQSTGAELVVHARQVHGATVRQHRTGASGFLLAPDCDGHLTCDAGILLTVSIADCVPIFLVAPGQRAIALLHAGWRGVAAGILEAGIEALRDRSGVTPGDLHLHLGPSISGDAYEVGPEVFEGLGLPVPPGPALLDLRAHLAERAQRLGVLPNHIGLSTRCTRSDEELFSHRGGDEGRQVAFLGWRRI